MILTKNDRPEANMSSVLNEPVIKRALISVSDKSGIIAFAKALQAKNIHILSTGGTASLLRGAGITIEEVAEYTGFPEILAGRVKTLHPKIHGGILARPGIDEAVIEQHGIPPIDLVVVNLYPFAETLQQPNCSLTQAVEQIDIGGPTLLRAAAKNFPAVMTIVDPADYALVINEIETGNGTTTLASRFQQAQKVFAHTAEYEADICNYFNRVHLNGTLDDFPQAFTLQFIKKQDLRYGENPHQKAALYVEKNPQEASLATATQHQGKALSFNNIADANAALECVKAFNGTPACVIVKHANPCGVALAESQLHAYQRAFATDPTSAFGGIIAFNQPLAAETARAILDNQFAEVLIAPEIETDALTILAHKPNIRVLSTGQWQAPKAALDYQRINSGLLVQDQDLLTLSPNNLKIMTQRQPSVQEFQDLLFAWEVVKSVKSNAIVYAKNHATVGIGAGQMSRVFSAIIANMKAADASLDIAGAVMASDAFFPFRDGIDAAAKVGITAIIQPGGSIRDHETIQAADDAGITMLFTGVRHFRH